MQEKEERKTCTGQTNIKENDKLILKKEGARI
jgi:hypothetical protein